MKNFTVGLVLLMAISSNASVKLGNEILVEKKFKPLVGKKIGLITNPSGVKSKLVPTVEILQQAPGV